MSVNISNLSSSTHLPVSQDTTSTPKKITPEERDAKILADRKVVLREQVEGGSTTGLFGFLAFVNAPAMVNKVIMYSKIDYSEGIASAILDMLQAPMKIVICVISAMKMLNYLPFIGIPLAAVTAPIFIVASALYLLVEFIRSIMTLVETCKFQKRESIDQVLKHLDHLSTSADNNTAQIQKYLTANEESLEKHIGSDRLANLKNVLNLQSQDDINLYLEKIKALITMQKVQALYNTYAYGETDDKFLGEIKIDDANPSEHKYNRYFQRRIGELAAKEFIRDAECINTYDLPAINSSDLSTLKSFNAQGAELLKMVNTQHKKVLKIHIFSIVVLVIAVVALVAAYTFATPTLFVASLAITALATLFSLVRTVANDAYINHTGAGFNLRLMIPVDLAAKEGESNSNSWRNSTTSERVGFVLANIFLLCIPLIFDRISKSKWLTKLRNGNSDTALADGNDYTYEASRFKREDMYIERHIDEAKRLERERADKLFITTFLAQRKEHSGSSPISVFADRDDMALLTAKRSGRFQSVQFNDDDDLMFNFDD